MGRINQRYYCGVMATGTGQGSPKAQSRAQSGKHNPQIAPPNDTSSSKLDNTSRLSGQCRAHIQELSAIQLEPQLCVITSTLPLQTVSLHQLILDGKGRWSWPERIQMVSYPHMCYIKLSFMIMNQNMNCEEVTLHMPMISIHHALPLDWY